MTTQHDQPAGPPHAVASAVDAAQTAQHFAHDWAGTGRAARWPATSRDIAGARALSWIDAAIGRLTAARAAIAEQCTAAWYPTPVTPELERLADEIADAHIDARTLATFDETATTVLVGHVEGRTADQLATAIMRAREMLSEHGIMIESESGRPVLLRDGGNAETRAHDIRTAATLLERGA